MQSHLLYSLIRKLADEKKVKVITFAEDVAASGGYMLACAGDEIYANPSSIIGSIGVIYSGFGFHKYLADFHQGLRTLQYLRLLLPLREFG